MEGMDEWVLVLIQYFRKAMKWRNLKLNFFSPTSDNVVALASIYLPSPTDEKSQILHRKNDEILGTEQLYNLLAEVFPEICGRVLQRLEDPRNIEEIFGTVCNNSQNLVYPGLSLKKFENFATEMTNLVASEITDTKGFWTILCEMNSDTFQKLFSELCRPLLKSQQELNPESVITSLHGIYVILETLSREFEVNRKDRLHIVDRQGRNLDPIFVDLLFKINRILDRDIFPLDRQKTFTNWSQAKWNHKSHTNL